MSATLAIILGTALAAAILMIVGGRLLWVGWRGVEVDRHPRCRACGYNLKGHPQRPDACPECNSTLVGLHRVRIGRRKVRPVMVTAGLILILLGLAPEAGWIALEMMKQTAPVVAAAATPAPPLSTIGNRAMTKSEILESLDLNDGAEDWQPTRAFVPRRTDTRVRIIQPPRGSLAARAQDAWTGRLEARPHAGIIPFHGPVSYSYAAPLPDERGPVRDPLSGMSWGRSPDVVQSPLPTDYRFFRSHRTQMPGETPGGSRINH